MAGDPSNLALYRKYRPATFAEVKGQDHVTGPLRQALLAGRVHHAYLFSGPRGCGKTSSARILARSLNCEQGPTPDPCGKCDSCVALAPGGPGSIDVIEIDAASHGGVDDARDLRERAFYAPVAGRYKVYIIDEAHMVTREGFNALLKLVEEPPPHLKFVFATTEPEKVIGTIRSRTHHYPFRLVPPQVLRELLERILDAEKVPYDPAALPLVIRAGAGSARDALSVLDQLLAGAGEAGITYPAALSLLGYTDASLLDETVEAFASGDGAAVFRVVDQVINAGHDPRRFAADLLDRFRDLIVLSAVGDAGRPGLLDVPADQLDRMREQVARFGAAELTRAAEVLNAGLTEMRGAASPRLVLELTCARVLLPAADSGEAAVLARLERIERRLGRSSTNGAAAAAPASAPAVPAAGAPPRAPRPSAAAPPAAPTQAPGHHPSAGSPPAGSPPAVAGDLDTASLRAGWAAILDAVRQVRKVSWIQLSNATVASLDGNVLTLEFARDGDVKGFTASRSDTLLAKVLRDRFGVQWRIQASVAVSEGGRPGPSGLVPGGTERVTARVGASDRPRGPGRAGGGEPPAHGGHPAHPSGSGGSGAPSGEAASEDQPARVPPAPRGRTARGAAVSPGSATVPGDITPGPPPGTGMAPTGVAGTAVAGTPVASAGLSGMELIRRELGGQIIGEVDSAEGAPGRPA